MPIVFTLTKKHPSKSQKEINYVVVKGQKFNIKEFEKWANVKLTYTEIFNIRARIAALMDGQFLQITYCPNLTKSWIHRFKEWLKKE